MKTKKRIGIILMILLFIGGCENRWETIAEGKVVKIEIKGVGGWGSPDAVRVWILEDGGVFSMSSYENVNVKVNDYITVKKCVGGMEKGRIHYIKGKQK